MDDAEFDAATRAAIEASLREMAASGGGLRKAGEGEGADWQPVAQSGIAIEKKTKKNRKQRYKANLVGLLFKHAHNT